jgi:hypothetical protein
VSHDVFISYSQADQTSAFDIVRALEARGVGVWVAPRDIAPSADWAEEIVNAIADARLMVLVFSAASNTSAQVRREVERAVHRNLAVLPFRIENVVPTKSLEYFLSTQHWMDAYTAPLEAHFERLATYIETRFSSESRITTSDAVAETQFPPNTSTTSEHRDVPAIQQDLIEYLGPIAKVLVERALRNGFNDHRLLEHLAAEIDSPMCRREFLERWTAHREKDASDGR